MSIFKSIPRMSKDEKAKVAASLNLCAVSVSQIIKNEDLFVLKQERENILNNLNLQNFVKHPALLDVIKRILDTITYLEIQAGDLEFIEKEYQHKLKNAIWTAIPNPGIFFSGGDWVTIAITAAVQIGTGYMNYRRNKSQYALEKDKSEWKLKRHELEQLYGLRAQLFETAWLLSADYGFEDKLRLTQKQLDNFSGALLEPDPLRRYVRLDVMSGYFGAFSQFWYYIGNAAMEVYRKWENDPDYNKLALEYKDIAIEAYNKFHANHFEFLREDIIAASCCLEHISLLDPKDSNIEDLLRKTKEYARSNYDILQQSILAGIQQGRSGEVTTSLLEMIVNDYNIGLNGILLSRFYIDEKNKAEYDKLRLISGEDNILPWADNPKEAKRIFIDAKKEHLAEKYRYMAQRVKSVLSGESSFENRHNVLKEFKEASESLLVFFKKREDEQDAERIISTALGELERALSEDKAAKRNLDEFAMLTATVSKMISEKDIKLEFAEKIPDFIRKLDKIADSIVSVI